MTAQDEGTVVDIPEETVIDIVDDTPPADRGRIPAQATAAEVSDEELTRYSDSRVQKRIAQLGRGYHDERRAKEAAQREKDEAVRLAQNVILENQRLQGSLANNQTALLEQAKRSVASEIEEARKEYKIAQEAFDTDGIIAAQEKLTSAKIRADKVNSYRPPPLQHTQNVVQPAPRPVSAPVVDAKTREWQGHNPWFGVDRKMTAYALSLHEDLVESGVPVSSEAYYSAINTDMAKRFPEAFAGAAANNSQRWSNVAPASRGTAPKRIVLTPTQVSLAKQLGLSLEVYGRSVAEGMRT